MKNVILMGKGKLAIKALKWFVKSDRYNLVCVVPVIPEPKWTDSFLESAEEHNLQIIRSGNYQDIPNVLDDSWNIDLVCSIFYDKIIKEWFIKKCERIINLHNAPLPKYRGVSPINWALKNNEKSHGVTIHEITPGIDDGPIISQIKYSIFPEIDEVRDVYERALDYGWTLFKETMPILDEIKPTSQNDREATYYSSKQNHLLVERRSFTRQESINSNQIENDNLMNEYAERLTKYREI